MTEDEVYSGGTLALDGASIGSGVTALAARLEAAVTSSGIKIDGGGVIEYRDVSVTSGGVLSLGAGGLADAAAVAVGGTVSGAGILEGDSTDQGVVSGVALDGELDVLGKAYGVKVGDLGGDSGELDVEPAAWRARPSSWMAASSSRRAAWPTAPRSPAAPASRSWPAVWRSSR